MSTFLVYDTASGTPKRWGACSETDLPLQAQTGEGVADITALTGWDANEANWIWDGTAIVANPLTDAQVLAKAIASKDMEISNECGYQIVSNFTSSALGSAYTYPSKDIDQANLMANVMSSLLPGLPSGWTTLQSCADSSGNWSYVPHTATQIQQVGSDGKAAIMAALGKLNTLRTTLYACTTVDQVNAISW